MSNERLRPKDNSQHKIFTGGVGRNEFSLIGIKEWFSLLAMNS